MTIKLRQAWTGIALFALVIGACSGVEEADLLAGSDGYEDPPDLDIGFPQVPEILLADVVVEVSEFSPLEDYEAPPSLLNTSFELGIERVVTHWERGLTGGDDSVPIPQDGTSLKAFEVRGFDGKRTSIFAGLSDVNGPLWVFLDYQVGTDQAELGGNWSVHGVATITDERLDFAGPAGPRYDRFFDAARSVQDESEGQVEEAALLRQLMAEMRTEHRTGEPSGVLIAAVVQELNAGEGSPQERWSSLDPTGRSLESDAVPDDVRERLTTSRLLFVVGEGLQDAPFVVDIVTRDGVGYSSLLSADTHAAEVVADPEVPWTAVVRRVDEELQPQGEPVAEFPVPEVAGPETVVKLELRKGTSSGSSSSVVVDVSHISESEMNDLLREIVQPGSDDYVSTDGG